MQQVDQILSLNDAESVEPPTEAELAEKQGLIESLVTMRYQGEENNFLHITEMNSFQKFALYKDTWPLFDFRMKLWKAYM